MIDKISVFISSSMEDEDDFNWSEVRNDVKKRLAICSYLEPFIIEDHASEFSSIQYFSTKVIQSDVIILLVKDEIRPGTLQEIKVAQKNKKPILLFFLESNEVKSGVEDFKKNVQNEDNLTYKEIKKSDFYKIDKIILHDLLENVIDFYKISHLRNSTIIAEESNFSIKSFSFDNSIYNKDVLNFSKRNLTCLLTKLNASNYLSQRKKSSSNIRRMDSDLINWFCLGDRFVQQNDFEKELTAMKIKNSTAIILKKRFCSTIQYFNGNKKMALTILDEAYNQADRNENIPNWLQSEILIDSRNIENSHYPNSQKYQSKIDNVKNIVNFPLGDRFIDQAFTTFEKEKFDIKTQSEDTIRFGNNLANSLLELLNYVYISLLCGSSTHLLIARERFADLLANYGILYKDKNLLFQSCKLIILTGNEVKFDKFIQNYWTEIVDFISAESNTLWQLANQIYSINKELMNCVLMKSVGQFMNNSTFTEGVSFLIKLSKTKMDTNMADKMLDAVFNNIERIDSEILIEILKNILIFSVNSFYNNFVNILSVIDISNSTEQNLTELSNLLIKNIKIILQRNGSPFFIINLIKQKKDVFQELYNEITRETNKENNDIISLNLDNIEKTSTAIFHSNLDSLKTRFSKINAGQSYEVFFGDNPVEIIENVALNSNLFKEINEELIPFYMQALSEKTPLNDKTLYLKSIIRFCIEEIKRDIPIPENLKNFFRDTYIKLDSKNSRTFSNVSELIGEYYFNLVKVILGISNEDLIYKMCVNYKEKSPKEREAFSFSIYSYIDYCLVSDKKISLFIQLVVKELITDHYLPVRKMGLNSTLLIYQKYRKNSVKDDILAMTLDPSPNFKTYFASILKNKYSSSNLSKEILYLLSKDSSYNVRIKTIRKQ